MLIIRDLFFGLRRFDALQKDLGIARNILSDRLKKLVAAGVLEKSPEAGHKTYQLTDKGLALQPILLAMTQWGDEYQANSKGKRVIFVDRKDGRPIKRIGVLAADGRRLKPRDIMARPGPGLDHQWPYPNSPERST